MRSSSPPVSGQEDSAVLRGTRARSVADLGCLLEADAERSLLREEMDEREDRETWHW